MNPRARGAALPETALVLTLMLALLMGGLRTAIVGYEQISADGAAFYHAHQTGIKATYADAATALDPNAATQQAFPRSKNATVVAQTVSPPDASVSTAYGFDQNDNRHGGTSLMQPLQTITTVTRSSLAPLTLFGGGSLLTITGVGIEPTFLETGVHGNINGSDFNTTASVANAANYFSQGENTPPYFGGFHYIRFCNVPDDATTSWNACPQTPTFLGLGMAEYLDADNWGRSPNGIAPAQSAVFWETLYHHDTYASLTSQLPADISTPASLAKAQAVLNRSVNPLVCTVYSWDSIVDGGFPSPGYKPGDYPLKPGATCGP